VVTRLGNELADVLGCRSNDSDVEDVDIDWTANSSTEIESYLMLKILSNNDDMLELVLEIC